MQRNQSHRTGTYALIAAVAGLLSSAAKPALAASTDTPLDTAKAFIAAYATGDLKAVDAVSLPDTRMDDAVAAQIAWLKATRHLHDAAVARFGRDRAAGVIAEPPSLADTAKELDQARVEVNGDQATVINAKDEKLFLVHSPDGWRIDRRRSFADVDPGAAPAATQSTPDTRGRHAPDDSLDIREMAASAIGINNVADRLKAGQYATPQDAALAIGGAVAAAMRSAPTTHLSR